MILMAGLCAIVCVFGVLSALYYAEALAQQEIMDEQAKIMEKKAENMEDAEKVMEENYDSYIYYGALEPPYGGGTIPYDSPYGQQLIKSKADYEEAFEKYQDAQKDYERAFTEYETASQTQKESYTYLIIYAVIGSSALTATVIFSVFILLKKQRGGVNL